MAGICSTNARYRASASSALLSARCLAECSAWVSELITNPCTTNRASGKNAATLHRYEYPDDAVYYALTPPLTMVGCWRAV